MTIEFMRQSETNTNEQLNLGSASFSLKVKSCIVKEDDDEKEEEGSVKKNVSDKDKEDAAAANEEELIETKENNSDSPESAVPLSMETSEASITTSSRPFSASTDAASYEICVRMGTQLLQLKPVEDETTSHTYFVAAQMVTNQQETDDDSEEVRIESFDTSEPFALPSTQYQATNAAELTESIVWNEILLLRTPTESLSKSLSLRIDIVQRNSISHAENSVLHWLIPPFFVPINQERTLQLSGVLETREPPSLELSVWHQPT